MRPAGGDVPSVRWGLEILAVGPDGTVRKLTLHWRAFLPEKKTRVTGLIDAPQFTARVPLH